jgi:hypothetical protein
MAGRLIGTRQIFLRNGGRRIIELHSVRSL